MAYYADVKHRSGCAFYHLKITLFPLTAILTPDATAGKAKRRIIQGISPLQNLIDFNYGDTVQQAVVRRMKLRALHGETVQ